MKATTFLLSIVFGSISIGCSVRSVATSVPPRIFREVHGLRVRSYQITPVTDDLQHYRAIEIHQLENLMLDQIPESSVNQLNTEIERGLHSLNGFDVKKFYESTAIKGGAFDQSHQLVRASSSQPTLVLEGYVDDYTPGIPRLRYIEQGNNHAVLTVGSPGTELEFAL